MIVNVSTLLGLISMNGSFEVHLAMLIMILWKVEAVRIPRMPLDPNLLNEEEMPEGVLRNYCILLHSFLLVSTYMYRSHHFSNGIILQIFNFVGLGIYILVISKLAIELYDAQPLSWMQTERDVIGCVWIQVECSTFFGNILASMVFMFMRGIKEQEVKITLVDKRKQLPNVDTIEALNVIIQQFQTFFVPMLVLKMMTATGFVKELNSGHGMAVFLGQACLVRFILANITLWVSWKRGPDFWLKIAPTIMYLVTLLNYIIIPLMFVGFFAVHFEKMQQSVYGLYMNCVCFIWFLQISFYFSTIRPFVYVNAMAYIASRKLHLEKKEREAMSQGNITVDFAQNNPSNNSQNSRQNQLYNVDDSQSQNNHSADQGMQYGDMNFSSEKEYRYMPDSPPTPPKNKVGDNSFVDENDRELPYTQQPRTYGDGELRIGTFLSLNEDIYSLGFASQVKNELIDQALLNEEELRPKSQYMPSKTPRGSFKMPAEDDVDEMNALDQEDQIFEDEQKHIEWEAKMVKIYEERNISKNIIFIHVFITAFCQGVLVSLLFVDVIGSDMIDIKENFGTLTESLGIIMARFICTIVLHLSQQDEVKRGLDLMKYALNHRNKFSSYKNAALMGFLQAFMTIAVETVNVLVILQSNTTQDIVFNFIAVAIISDFDNFVFSSLSHEKLKELVLEETASELLSNDFTSSKKALSFDKGGEDSGQIDENGEPICMKINYWRDRSCVNKLLWLVYKTFRIIFVSFYFYFYPPLSIYLTFQLPFIFRSSYKNAWVDISRALYDPSIELTNTTFARANITEDDYYKWVVGSFKSANKTAVEESVLTTVDAAKSSDKMIDTPIKKKTTTPSTADVESVTEKNVIDQKPPVSNLDENVWRDEAMLQDQMDMLKLSQLDDDSTNDDWAIEDSYKQRSLDQINMSYDSSPYYLLRQRQQKN